MLASHTYEGPSVPEMIANHTLADNIIAHHHSDVGNEILDPQEIARLRRFVQDPDTERSVLLNELNIPDAQPRGQYQGSLVGFIALKHGYGNVMTGEEIERLRVWFAEGDRAPQGVGA